MLEVGGVTGSGQGVSTDILEAAGRAYVRALSNAISGATDRGAEGDEVREPEPAAAP